MSSVMSRMSVEHSLATTSATTSRAGSAFGSHVTSGNVTPIPYDQQERDDAENDEENEGSVIVNEDTAVGQVYGTTDEIVVNGVTDEQFEKIQKFQNGDASIEEKSNARFRRTE